MKGNNEVVREFSEYVNMTASELEKWLKSKDSQSAGWPKGEEGGESVGHDSGRRIVEILKANPKSDPKNYTSEQLQHMRKVVSYCKRHLAQESKGNSEKSVQELKKTKSYISLKNWGHDPLKDHSGHDHGEEEDVDVEGQEAEEEKGNEEESSDVDEKQTGDKRKAANDQTGKTKKHESRKGAGNKSNTTTRSAKKRKDEDDEDAKGKHDQDEDKGKKKSDTKKTTKGPKPGDTVSWNWGNGQPEGKVLDVKGEKTSITTKRGNKVTRDGNPSDPAVVLDTGKSKAIKSSHELNDT